MLPRAAPAELAASSIGPTCALLVVTSVFDPADPNGNLRWGFYALAALYGVAAVFMLRARTMNEMVKRALVFAALFPLTGCAFVWWSEPASRLDGGRVYGVGGHAITGVLTFAATMAVVLVVAWPVLRAANHRALDHGEGFVTTYAALAVPVVAGFAQYSSPLENRRYDAIVAAFALPSASLVLVLVQRARRFLAWRRVARGGAGGSIELVEARPDEARIPLLFRAFDGNMCMTQTSRVSYREGGMRLPLARVPASVPDAAPLRLALPAIPLVAALVTFSGALASARTLGVPQVVAEYANGRTEVHRPWWVEAPPGWRVWQLRLPRDEYTLVGIDPSSDFHDGPGLFTRLAAAGLPDRELAEAALLTLFRQSSVYVPNRPPCARPKDERFEHREGDSLVFCSVSREPTRASSTGLRVRRYRASLATGALSLEGEAWLPDDGSVEDSASER